MICGIEYNPRSFEHSQRANNIFRKGKTTVQRQCLLIVLLRYQPKKQNCLMSQISEPKLCRFPLPVGITNIWWALMSIRLVAMNYHERMYNRNDRPWEVLMKIWTYNTGICIGVIIIMSVTWIIKFLSFLSVFLQFYDDIEKISG